MPGQQMRYSVHSSSNFSELTCSHRKKNVRRKLNAMALEFVDKVVLLVDGNLSSLKSDLPS